MADDAFMDSAQKQTDKKSIKNEELLWNACFLAVGTKISVLGGVTISKSEKADDKTITITKGKESITLMRAEDGSRKLIIVSQTTKNPDFLNSVLTPTVKTELESRIAEQNKQADKEANKYKDNISNASAWIQKNQPEVFGQASNSPGKEFTIQGPNGTLIGISLNSRLSSSGQPDYAIRVREKGKDYYGTYDPITGATTITYESEVTGRGTALVKENTNVDWYLVDEVGQRDISRELQKTLQNYYISTVENMARIEDIIKVASTVPTLKTAALAAVSTSTIMEKLSESGSTPRVFDENLAKTRETEEHLKSASVTEKEINDAIKKALREVELEKLLFGQRDGLSGEINREADRSLSSMLNRGFNAFVVPIVIDMNIKDAGSRAALKKAITVKDGEITNMPTIAKIKGITAREREALERQIGSAWETAHKDAHLELKAYAAERKIENEKVVILSNLMFIMPEQRESAANEIGDFAKNVVKADPKTVNAITSSIKERSARDLANAMKGVEDSRLVDYMNGVMLRLGTEMMHNQVSERKNIEKLEELGGNQIASLIREKAEKMKMSLSSENKALITDIRENGLRANREKALMQLSGALFEVMADNKIIERGEKTNLPKAG
jgi:hypothetical protein